IVAKSKASIWNNTYRMLKPYFEQTAKQRLAAGLKVLVNVSVSFHELYGFNLVIQDIDPTYTIGDLAKKREETINRIKSDGVFDMNHDLRLPLLVQRIAVISSATAAGYGDFSDQISNNNRGYVFYTKLFPAIMQGDNAHKSVIEALDRICLHEEKFDAVVIIRGGGATTDMLAFDDYELASCVAQFPLPVISGIGHERDESVVDLVANTRCKTPTAVAAFLIERAMLAEETLNSGSAMLTDLVTRRLTNEKLRMNNVESALSRSAKLHLKQEEASLMQKQTRLALGAKSMKERKKRELADLTFKLENNLRKNFERQKHNLELLESLVNMASPEFMLKRGYSLTLINGKVLKSAKEIKNGDEITTLLIDGNLTSEINNIKLKK
ncbi:MAG: exodeoxyribonuclease VII large subunit, partial [Paludibacteraceae bacterium]|nr:exodeoxyribonuclease VII large subunit [Paludibacteraceae bacterium]